MNLVIQPDGDRPLGADGKLASLPQTTDHRRRWSVARHLSSVVHPERTARAVQRPQAQGG